MTDFDTVHLPSRPRTIAPDGSDVRVLLGLKAGGMAHFELGPNQTSKAVTHRTVGEIWYFLSGRGEMWRGQNGKSTVIDVYPGVCLNIPVGGFRADRSTPRTDRTSGRTRMSYRSRRPLTLQERVPKSCREPTNARQRQNFLNYQQTVLEALGNMEDALSGYQQENGPIRCSKTAGRQTSHSSNSMAASPACSMFWSRNAICSPPNQRKRNRTPICARASCRSTLRQEAAGAISGGISPQVVLGQ